jgi:large subunit ribosomal protein L22
MPYTAKHRFARISARKVRPLADLVRGERVDDALAILRYQPQRGARMLEKLIKSALGNAEDQRAPNVGGLVIVDARVDGGPAFKRMRPRARGMAHVVARRFSHITVSVE